MTLILIRHGESEANRLGYTQGESKDWRDTPLTEKGLDQARKVSERLKTEQIDYIFASDLKRAKKTAEEINKNHNKEIIFDSRLREHTIEESKENFEQRISDFMEYANKFRGKILIVAHGGVNLAIMAISTGDRKKGREIVGKIRIYNTSLSLIERRGEHYDIKIESSINHLEPDEKVRDIFEKIKESSQDIKPLFEDEIQKEINLREDDKPGKLKHILKEEGYRAKDLIVIFDWKDLPIPERILNILSNSTTKQIHRALRVKIHGNHLYLDPLWENSLERKGFPVNKNWSGLEDTNQITKGELRFFKKRTFIENREQILRENNIKQDKEELKKFHEELNKWINSL